MKNTIPIVFLTCSLPLIADTATGAVIHTAGQTRLIDPPASTQLNARQSNKWIRGFMEYEGTGALSLLQNVRVDITEPGRVAKISQRTPGWVTKDTQVEVYNFWTDPRRNPVVFRGSVTFDTDVLGIITTDRLLGRSDDLDSSLAGGPTLFSTGLRFRGAETRGNQDWIRLSDDRRTVHFRFKTWGVIDQVRIITEFRGEQTPPSQPPIVPASSALTVLGLGGMMAARRRR